MEQLNRKTLLNVIKEQNEVIDVLFALLIKADTGFKPTKSGKLWQVFNRGKAIIYRAEETGYGQASIFES